MRHAGGGGFKPRGIPVKVGTGESVALANQEPCKAGAHLPGMAPPAEFILKFFKAERAPSCTVQKPKGFSFLMKFEVIPLFDSPCLGVIVRESKRCPCHNDIPPLLTNGI